jgi:hypothetical protein
VGKGNWPFKRLFEENFEFLGFYVWRCRRCGKEIRSNGAGAASHLAKHVRQALAQGPADLRGTEER